MPHAELERWKKIPLTKEPLLTVVIPTHNEEKQILGTIQSVSTHLARRAIAWELIISDDGSQDQTVPLVESLGYANLLLLQNEPARGKGWAVRQGVLAARGRYVLFDDAVNATPIEELDRMLHKLDKEGYEVVVGVRAAADVLPTRSNYLEKWISRFLRWAASRLMGVNLRDPACDFKLYRREVAQRLHQAQTLDGEAFDLEVLYLAVRMGYKIADVPVGWSAEPNSLYDPIQSAAQVVTDLVFIAGRDLFGKYKVKLHRHV